MPPTNINIAIVDDHTLFRDGLANLLSEFDHISILFNARNGQDMQEQLRRHGVPDVILMDINMPVMDGNEATAWLKQHHPPIYVLALSMYEDDINIIKMLRKGATGYILKECNANELVRAIQSVMDTGYYINELVSGKLIRSMQDEDKPDAPKDKGSQFTTREKEFLKLCCSELTYKEIADQMHLSPRTVDGYREDIFERLQIRSRTGIVLYAIKHKMVEL
jgi:DNA-binding NarL/FixJ family response regulator